MRKKVLTTLALNAMINMCFGNQNDPVLMKINGKEIRKSEFEYIYYKNNNQQMVERKSLEEYVDLFVNFKLKVEEAIGCGLDTTASFKKELSGYRNQLAKPYLVDESVDEALVREAYDRLKENVECSHILFKLDEDASDEEVARVYKKAVDCRKTLDKGADFAQTAEKVSEDPSAKQNKGYLGYISGFMMVYPFETAAYNTPSGSISEPVRSQFGYHIVKVHNRRKDEGQILTAHIMKMLPKDASAAEAERAEREIYDAYSKLAKGADFAELAKTLSDDKPSAAKGGELIWIGRGRIVKEYEDQAFSLRKSGDYSKPFKSPYGWHIVKLIDRKDVEPLDEKRTEITKRIARDERNGKSKQVLVEKLKKTYAFKKSEAGEALLSRLTVNFAPVDSVYISEASKANMPLFEIAGHKYTTANFASYMTGHKSTRKNSPKAILSEKLSQFEADMVLAYEDSRLESKYADFRNLMREYHDGILLFEISNTLVWEKASTDISGLEDFFNARKSSYKWDDAHFKGYVIRCSDQKVAKEAKKMARKIKPELVAEYINTAFNNDSVKRVSLRHGLFAAGDNEYVDALEFRKGKIQNDEQYPVTVTSGKKLKSPESYQDVKGLVISDYQNYLEKRWIESLRAKYSVEINEDVLNTVKPL